MSLQLFSPWERNAPVAADRGHGEVDLALALPGLLTPLPRLLVIDLNVRLEAALLITSEFLIFLRNRLKSFVAL